MTITELAIKRPSLIIVIFTILIGGGMLSYKQLSYQLLPDFSPPILTVTTPYPGASPSVVESQVSEPMEDALSGLENIKEVTSFMFSKPLKASSIGSETCDSTMEGDAPGYGVVTVKIGGAKSGNNW